MYLKKRKGYWLEVYKDGIDFCAMWHKDYNSIMHLANHNIQIGNVVKVTNCETEKQESLIKEC